MHIYYMMKCAGCEKNSKKIICNNCKFDPNITMSRTDVKHKFKLSDDDLYKNRNKLICIDFNARHYSGRKYIIKNIIELRKIYLKIII